MLFRIIIGLSHINFFKVNVFIVCTLFYCPILNIPKLAETSYRVSSLRFTTQVLLKSTHLLFFCFGFVQLGGENLCG